MRFFVSQFIQATMTNYYRLHGLETTEISQETEKAKINAMADLVSGGGPFPGSQMDGLTVTNSTWQEGQGISLGTLL